MLPAQIIDIDGKHIVVIEVKPVLGLGVVGNAVVWRWYLLGLAARCFSVVLSGDLSDSLGGCIGSNPHQRIFDADDLHNRTREPEDL